MFNINWWQFTPNEALGVDDYLTNENDGILVYPNPSSTGLFTLSKEAIGKCLAYRNKKLWMEKEIKLILLDWQKVFTPVGPNSLHTN